MNHHSPNTTAKYLLTADAIRQAIQSGALAPRSKLGTEDDLMEQYHVGRNTIRHAVALLEEEGLLRRVQGSGTYVKQPEREKTMTIGVMATYLSEYVFPTMIQGIEEETARLGYRFLIRSTKNRIDEEKRLLQEFIDNPVDGLIIQASKSAFPNPNLALYQQLAKLRIPFIFFCNYYPALLPYPQPDSSTYAPLPAFGATAVITDDFQGGYLATETLIQQGHRHIAGLFKADDITGQQRYAGFLAAMRTHQLEIDDGCIFWYSTGHRKRMFEGSWAEAVYDTVSPASAVVCFNDQIAVPLMNLLLQKGKRIPEDLAIISFDNSSLAELAPVPLTSLNYDKKELGRLVVQELIHLIEKPLTIKIPDNQTKEKELLAPVMLPWTLVERESTLPLKER